MGSALCLSLHKGTAPAPPPSQRVLVRTLGHLQTRRTHGLSAGLLVSGEGHGWFMVPSLETAPCQPTCKGVASSHTREAFLE